MRPSLNPTTHNFAPAFSQPNKPLAAQAPFCPPQVVQARLIFPASYYSRRHLPPHARLLVEDEVRWPTISPPLCATARVSPSTGLKNGQAGDDCASNLCYDLIVLDLMLPKLDASACSSVSAPAKTQRRF